MTEQFVQKAERSPHKREDPRSWRGAVKDGRQSDTATFQLYLVAAVKAH